VRYLKKYRYIDSSLKEEDISIDEIKDIFIDLKDNSLEVGDVFLGSSISIGKEEVIYLSNFTKSISIKSLIIRLTPLYFDSFDISNDIYINLQNSIGHITSLYNIKLDHIYLNCMMKQCWFNSVITFEKAMDHKYKGMNQYGFVLDPFISSLVYIDLVFSI